jgi:acetyl-CoA C-acetyltransferase/acetyl-CoA acyltransferase
METVSSAIQAILAGQGDTFLCAGVEVMSAYPLIMGPGLTKLFGRLARTRSLGAALGVWSSFRPKDLAPTIALVEGLSDPVSGMIMGKTAELLAREGGISREAADEYAFASHRRAARARDGGRFEAEVLPWLPLGSREGARAVTADDGIRDGQTTAALGRMRPYFVKPDGTVTVGTSCGISDGACALLVTTRERARELGIEPLATIRALSWAGLDPARMGLGPVYASAKVLDAAGVALSDVGSVELNEAFAAQVLACQKAFASDEFARKELGRGSALGELSDEILNQNGGAIALGHPVGATGARLLLTSAHELLQCDSELALATLCIGGGQGGAALLERCSS